MVIRPPDSIFKRIVAGKLSLKPEDFLPRKTRLGVIPPKFPEGRLAKLRKKLLNAGIDPIIQCGLPPAIEPSTQIFIPPTTAYKDACKEIKYDYVKQQVAQMPKIVAEWRKTRDEERQKALSKKLPF